MGMAFLRPLAALLAVVVLAVPATAVAQRTNAPPGNSGVDEYLETIPAAGGNKVPKRLGEKPGRSVLTRAQRRHLEGLGPDGRALSEVVDATAPQKASKGAANDGHQGRPLADSGGRSPLGQLFEAFGGSDDGDGMGALLPAILVAALLGTLVLVLLRRRSAS
jgi:hypothetical protein